MSGVMRTAKKKKLRIRTTVNRKWQRKEEIALVKFFKQNPDIEKPTARTYYTKFIFESGMDIDWNLVRWKVRNMRTLYLKAKDHEFKADTTNSSVEDIRNQVLSICWYVDDFDILFPNLMNNHINKCSDSFLNDELSKDASLCDVDNPNKSFILNILPEEESTASSVSKSVDGELTVTQSNMFSIKEEKQDEDSNIKQQEPKKARESSKFEKRRVRQEKQMEVQQTPFRNRPNPIRKWQRDEEVALILFLKENRDFEKPNARIYYTKFLFESGMDSEWMLVRSKVRNMRVAYRKAKEHEIKVSDSCNCDSRILRNQVIKICWFVDDFDLIFPNEMNNSACLQVYKNPDSIFDEESEKDNPINKIDCSSKTVNNNILLEEDSTSSSLSNSVDGDILTVQKNLFKLKAQKRDEDKTLRQQELELAKEKLKFEKEKFRQEIRLKEKEIESEEKLKVMEFQMKERIAIKKLEIDEMLALRSIDKPVNSYNNIYHNLI